MKFGNRGYAITGFKDMFGLDEKHFKSISGADKSVIKIQLEQKHGIFFINDGNKVYQISNEQSFEVEVLIFGNNIMFDEGKVSVVPFTDDQTKHFLEGQH